MDCIFPPFLFWPFQIRKINTSVFAFFTEFISSAGFHTDKLQSQRYFSKSHELMILPGYIVVQGEKF